MTADKYLLPKLSDIAGDKFRSVAEECTSAEDIFDIIQAISKDFSYNSRFVKLAATLREKHLDQLLKNDGFRAQLDSSGKEALWQQLDELASRFLGEDAEEKWYTLCPEHTQGIFHGPVNERYYHRCTMCDRGSNVARQAWTKKRTLD